ncbi:MAG TPA: DUF441 domain-containing protein [Bacillota bacterium]|jgi:uncharacterized membrane protein (DUF441 family)|nr:DUF441 domain-containing protein [Peptococcaceae bacterium MAG4]NLW37535.1 DUF441 domain-containing protein [Peptococcaceae bacterium]HPU35302.1 DUF441 domain-containing protein [Bacillota bacterium]HPZ43794.1 DUF441 domain-containing protein [Bacillota bacterium]HQD76282.1 DUF441 domain-containing protein [Bacillota bacterium]
MSGVNMLVALLLIGIMARSNLIVTAACLLLIAKFTNLKFVFPLLERRGLEMGILFLMLSILVPLANGKITEQDIIYNLTSLPGILAIAGGALATCLNTQGLKLLKVDPEIVFGLVIGSILGIVFLHGVPVGPLMAAAVAALFSRGVRIFRR